MALCLELLNTRGCAKEGAWEDSRFVDSFSMEEGVFPSSTARSILDEERREPTEVSRSSRVARFYNSRSTSNPTILISHIQQICRTLHSRHQQPQRDKAWQHPIYIHRTHTSNTGEKKNPKSEEPVKNQARTWAQNLLTQPLRFSLR